MKYQGLESITVVKNKNGAVATMRFTDPQYDKIVSSSSKPGVYVLVDKHIAEVFGE